MRRLFVMIVCCFVLFIPSVANADAHKMCVVFANGNVLVMCDQFETNYTAVDFYTGFVDEGDWLHGETEMYGQHNFYNINKDCNVSCFVDEFWLSKQQAIEWLKERIK